MICKIRKWVLAQPSWDIKFWYSGLEAVKEMDI